MQIANVNLPIIVTARHMEMTEALRNYATRKVESLHLDYPKIIEAHVICAVEKYRQRAEIVLVCANHITIDASAETDDMYASLDEAVAKIGRQMRKYKTRVLRSHRPRHGKVRQFDAQVIDLARFDETFGPIAEPAPATPVTIAAPEPEPAIPVRENYVVQRERYAVRPMFLDEAILQMQVSSMTFLIFHNEESHALSVLHRRDDQTICLIEPDQTTAANGNGVH